MGTSRSGLYNTNGSRRKVSEYALVHSNEGTFKNVNSPNPKRSPFRMASGGYGEDNIRLLNKYGIKYNIVKTYPNGVRVGSVEGHKDKSKREQNKQAWFPKSWTAKDIQKAGEHVASLKCNKHVKDGHNMYGTWKGVRVRVKRTNGRISTIFPDLNSQIKRKVKNKMFNKDKFKELAKERENTDWDYKIDKIWSEMLSMILEDDDSFNEFINYMKTEMTGDEYGTLSEISDEIAGEKPSYQFIEAYKQLSIKYPEETKKWNIAAFIDDAERIVEHCLESK